MPPKGQNKKPTWSATGPDGIQLFRDFYFSKYPKETPPTLIFEDPTRNYNVYNKEGFYRHIKATINKVDTYKEFGTGVAPALLVKLDLNNPPSPEECEPKLSNEDDTSDEDDEDEDEDYDNSDKDDLSLESFESESFLGRLQISDNNNNSTKKATSSTIKKVPATATMTRKKDERNKASESLPIRSFTTTASSSTPFLTPVLVECGGGNLSGTVPMLGGVEYEFYIADDGKSVVQKTFVPDECLDAKKMFYRRGLSDHHVTISGFQTDINKKKKMSVMQVNDKDKHFYETTLFSFPYEIESSFYDEEGNRVDTIFEGRGPNGLLWGYFYLKKKLEEEKKRTKARILRDNRRQTPDDEGMNSYGGGGNFSKGYNGMGFQGNVNGGFSSQQMNSPYQNNGSSAGFGGTNQFTSPNHTNNNSGNSNSYFPNFSGGSTNNNHNSNNQNFMSPSMMNQSPKWSQNFGSNNNGMGMFNQN